MSVKYRTDISCLCVINIYCTCFEMTLVHDSLIEVEECSACVVEAVVGSVDVF